MAKKKPIDALIASTPRVTRGRSLKDSLPPKTYAAIEWDLQAVVDAERNGDPTPSIQRLRDFFRAEYGVSLSHGAVYEWKKRVQNG